MNMWTNYSQGMAAGTAGGFYDLSEHAVVSRLNGQADTALRDRFKFCVNSKN